jgi:hypothetical protein
MISEWLIIIILIRYPGDLMIIVKYFNKDYNPNKKKYVSFVISLSLKKWFYLKVMSDLILSSQFSSYFSNFTLYKVSFYISFPVFFDFFIFYELVFKVEESFYRTKSVSTFVN